MKRNNCFLGNITTIYLQYSWVATDMFVALPLSISFQLCLNSTKCVYLCMWRYWHICDGPAFSFQRCKYCLFLAIYFGRDMKTIPMVSDNLRMLCTFKLKLKVSKYGPVRQFRHTHTCTQSYLKMLKRAFPHTYI